MAIDITKNAVYDFLTESRFRIVRHALLILILMGYSAGQSMYVFDDHTGKLGLVSYLYTASLGGAYILLTYFNIYYLAPHFLKRNRFLPFSITLLGSILFLVATKNGIEYGLSLYLKVEYPFNGIKFINYITEVILTTICISSSLISYLLRMWIADRKLFFDIEGQKLKSSIQEFKDQINPVFLFNLIQYASEEVKSEPRKTSELIMRLSELLRYELYDCKRNKVILKSDIDFVSNYLFLTQQIAEDFSYSIFIDGNTNRFIQPFLFMPFIRETLSKRPNNLSLFYEIDNDTVTLTCKYRDGLSESSTIKQSLNK